jgi:outer membrane murein-binding lipoprotein Lpp
VLYWNNSGYVGIGNTSPGYLLVVGTGGAYCNGTTWVNGSDRNSKEDFAAVNPREVLAKVSALPITEWKYKVESDGTEHLGPMAQDFHAAFGLNGADDRHIATVDESGVALAAIQGLNQKLNEKDAEIQTLKTQNDSLAQRLNELETAVKRLAANK